MHAHLALPDGLRPVSAWQLAHPDPDADNAEREQVAPQLRPLNGPYCRLPPHSVTLVRAL